MDKSNLYKNLNKITQPSIAIIGDFGLDIMVYGKTQRISREAPVLILEHTETKHILGMASNAAHNVSVLNGGKAYSVGVYRDNYDGKLLKKTLNEAKINSDWLIDDVERKTTTKTRISGACSQSVTQQIVRIDSQSTQKLSKTTEDKVIGLLDEIIKKTDGAILSDYNMGFLTQNIITKAIETANKYKKIIVADIQQDFDRYKGVYAITPNHPDCEKYLGFKLNTEADFEKAGKILLDKLNLQKALITRGESGMILFEKNGANVDINRVAAFNRKEVFDVTGAGDTVVAAFTLGLCAGLKGTDAMHIGNLAASVVIRYFGCYCADIEELKTEVQNMKETL